MKIRYAILPLLFCVLMSGCRMPQALPSLDEAWSNHYETLAQQQFGTPAERLAAVEAMLRANRPELAQKTLQPLVEAKAEPERVTALQTEIQRQLELKSQVVAMDPDAPALGTDRAKRELMLTASKRLDRVHSLISSGKNEEAEQCLQPLIGTQMFTEEVRELQRQIAQQRELERADKERQASRSVALLEVEQAQALPDSYGRTIIISRDKPLLETPFGPMEELVNRKVSMRLEDAGVKDLVLALSELDGLNLIMDEALTEEQKITISVQDVSLKELLSYVARNMGVAFHLGENTIWVTESVEPAGTGPKLETKIYHLQHGLIPPAIMGEGEEDIQLAASSAQTEEDMELEDVLDTLLIDGPEGALYRIYRTRNLLVVRNSRDNLRLIEELLKAFDRPCLQVLIEARFIEVSEDELDELGVNITDAGIVSSDHTVSAIEGLTNLLNAPEEGGGTLTVTGILGHDDYTAVLYALAKCETAQNLSAPRVTVLNNQAAKVRKGDVIFYFKEYEPTTLDVGTSTGTTISSTQILPSGEPEELELGITLEVEPSIGNDGKTVVLAINTIINSLVKWLDFDVAGDGDSTDSETARDDSGDNNSVPTSAISLPMTTEAMISTKVVLRSGETVVMGGTAKSFRTTVEKGIPLLSKIPYLGFLFRYKKTTVQPTNLLIFVTATIVGPTGEFIDYQERPATLREARRAMTPAKP